MKTKGRPVSKNIENRRFEKAWPKAKMPYITKKAHRETMLELKAKTKRVKTEYTLDPMKRNELMKNTIVKSRGKGINIKTKVKPDMKARG